MSAFITIDCGEPLEFASNTGASSLWAWVDELSADAFPDLAHLREYGWTEPASELEKELAAALKSHPPEDDNVRHVAESLLEIVSGEADAVVTLSNGVVAGDPGPAPPA